MKHSFSQLILASMVTICISSQSFAFIGLVAFGGTNPGSSKVAMRLCLDGLTLMAVNNNIERYDYEIQKKRQRHSTISEIGYYLNRLGLILLDKNTDQVILNFSPVNSTQANLMKMSPEEMVAFNNDDNREQLQQVVETLSLELGNKPNASNNERQEIYQKVVLQSGLEIALIHAGEKFAAYYLLQ